MKEKIKELRKSLGLNLRDFAQRLGVSHGTVSAWERGVSSPTVKNVFQICQAFNVRREWLENGDGEMFEQKTDGMTEDEKTERLLLSEFRRLTPTSQDALLRFVIQLAEDPRYRG